MEGTFWLFFFSVFDEFHFHFSFINGVTENKEGLRGYGQFVRGKRGDERKKGMKYSRCRLDLEIWGNS